MGLSLLKIIGGSAALTVGGGVIAGGVELYSQRDSSPFVDYEAPGVVLICLGGMLAASGLVVLTIGAVEAGRLRHAQQVEKRVTAGIWGDPRGGGIMLRGRF